jgi:MFS family permease
LNYFLTHDTFEGATTLQYALIGGLSISVCLLVAPLVGLSQKWVGSTITMLIGSGIIALGLLTASWSTEMWQLFLSQGVGFGVGMGFLYVTATRLLPPWFSSRRSLAVGISTSGSGLGGLAYSLVAGRAIETVGVTWCYRILALVSLLVNIISSILLKERPKSSQAPKQKVFDPRSFGQIPVILVVFWGTVTELGFITLLLTLPNYATSIGLNATQGSVAGALLNLGLGIGRPLIGYFSDRLGRINVAACMTTICGILCFSLWIPASTYGLLLAFALLAGTVFGVFWCTVSPILAEVVGLANFASVFGTICFSLVIPTTFAEPIAMQVAGGHSQQTDAHHYRGTQIFVGSMFLAGGLSLWLLRSWQILDLERKATAEEISTLTSRAYGPASRDSGPSASRLLNRLFVLKRV